MLKVIRGATLTAVLSLTAVSSAGATTGPAMIGTNGSAGTASNTGAVSGNSTSYAAHTFTVGGATVTCGDANTTVKSTATSSVTAESAAAGCALLVSGTPVAVAAIHSTCDWSMSFSGATFNNSTGAGTGGSMTTNCPVLVSVPAVNCQINIAAQTKSGISVQNVNSSGGNDTSATPWGAKFIVNVTGISYTVQSGTSCPGVAGSGTGNYAGTAAVHNVFGAL